MKIRWNNQWVDLRGVPEVFVEDPEDEGSYLPSKIYVGEADPAVGGDIPYVWLKPSDLNSAATVTFDDTGLTVATGATVQDALESLDGQFTYGTYTPTVNQGGSVATSSVTGRYIQVGKVVHYWGKATVSAAGVTNNAVYVTAPVSQHASYHYDVAIGTGSINDSGTQYMSALCRFVGSSAIGFFKTNNDAESWIGQNPNFALANNDRIGWSVTYEAA